MQYLGPHLIQYRVVRTERLIDDAGAINHAAIGDRGGDQGHLERGCLHIALSDRHVGCVARIPACVGIAKLGSHDRFPRR